MTDPLTALRLPSRPLPAGGEADAIAQGRRSLRRRRIATAAVSGGSAAAVAVLVVVVTGAGVQGDSLSTVTPAGGSTLASSTPAPTSTSTLPPGVVPSPLPTPSSLPIGIGPSESATPSESPTPAPSDTSPAATGPYVGFEPTGPDGGPTITRTMSNDPMFCERNAEVADYRHPDGWCSTLTTSAPSGFVAGHRISFTFEMCKAPESGAMTLHFDSRQEIGLNTEQIADDGSQVIRWSWDNRFDFPADAHSLTFNAGDCATWVVTWSGEGYDGYAVPEGAYDAVALLNATEYTSDDADYSPPVAILRQSMDVSWR
jgi:hypothetical protein